MKLTIKEELDSNISKLKNYVQSVINDLVITSINYKPTSYKFAIENSKIVFRANYDDYGVMLDYNNSDKELKLISNGSISLNSKKTNKLANLLFNLNIDSANTFLNKLVDYISDNDIDDISDLTDF